MNSSEIEKAKEIVAKYLTIKDPLEKADVIFVAGGKSLAPVERAAEIFKQGFAKRIVFICFSGKFSIWKNESKVFYRKFVELGIPPENLTWEPLSTNTLNEVTLGVPFMEKHGVKHDRVILVTRSLHQRRFFNTFTHHYPNLHYINVPAEDDRFEEEGIVRLIGEVERLQTYGDKGDIKKEKIPEEILVAVKLLKTIH